MDQQHVHLLRDGFARRIHNEALLGRQCGLYQIRVQQKFGEKFLCRTVTVFRDPERSGSVSVEITGRLNAVLGGVRLAHWVRGVWDRVVAREGLEPPTPGL